MDSGDYRNRAAGREKKRGFKNSASNGPGGEPKKPMEKGDSISLKT